MTVIIGYESALQYWRAVGPDYLGDSSSRQAAGRKASRALQSKEKIRVQGDNQGPAEHSLPIHAIVGTPQAQTRTKNVISHEWSRIPPNAVDAADKEFLVSTPEFVFLQMASRLSLTQLILLGFEMCGTYSLIEGRPALQRQKPLTTFKRLKRFISSSSGMTGKAKADRAISFLMSNSASPMESVMIMLLCLPYRLGGYGLIPPTLNYRVDVSSSLTRMADRSYYVCDACWVDQKICLEYDSRLFHSSDDRRESDARRRNSLIALGFTVLTVSADQISSGEYLNRLANQIAEATGKELRFVDPGFTRTHIALRNELLGSFRQSK